MGQTRRTPPRHRHRRRRIASALLAGLLALGGGLALVVGGESPAANAAPGDVFFTTPEYTPITNSPFLFQGEASPLDAITITSSHGPDCHAVADALGIWSCNMTFTSSIDLTVITVSRDVDDGNPATQESDGHEHSIALPVTVNTNFLGDIWTNANPPAVSGSGAWPGATMVVTINGAPCAGGPADGLGNWSCTGPVMPDGTYPVSAQQDVGGAVSDAVLVDYRVDTTTAMPQIDYPYDSTLAPVTIQHSNQNLPIGGGPGSAEPYSTVFVWVTDYGTTDPGHPNAGPFNFWCNSPVQADGSWECIGSTMTVGHFWVVGVYAEDFAGNTSPSVDDEFAIEILPPPAAPVITAPAPIGELSPIDITGTVDGITTEVRVEELGVDLCGAIIPVAGTFTCPGLALTPGVHNLDVIALDTYGTGTDTALAADSWAPPSIMSPIPGSVTSASTFDIVGAVPVGADVTVEVNLAVPPGCAFIAVTAAYSCTTQFLPVGGPYPIEISYVDPLGDFSATVNSDLEIVATLPAPGFTAPGIGYQSTSRTVQVSTTNAPLGTMFVREGLTNLCAPTAVAVGTHSCTTIPLSVGTHTITISQRDQYGVMGASAQRIVTILPPPTPQPLTMKTFGITFQVLGEDGKPIGEEGVGTGDLVTISASNVPPGTLVQTEIHSDPVKLGQMTVGQTGQMVMTARVPAVPPGPHEVVVGATAPGYWPGTFTSAIQVRGLKQMTDGTTEEVVKELGEPEEVKELGTPAGSTSGAGDGSGSGGPGSGVGGGGWEDPSVFGTTVESPFDQQAHAFALSPAGIVLSGSIAIAFLLLVGFPAELLESTIRSNYDRAFGWLARLRRRVGRMLAPVARALANPWVGSGLTVLAASIILGFADPDFGFTGASVRLVLAMILAVLAINVGLSLIVMKVARRAFDVAAVLKPMPAALAIVALSVLVSRLAGISPGFLFGVVLGVAYARELRLRDDARLGVLGVGLTIGAGVLAWVGYGVATAVMSGQGFVNNLVIEALAAITLEALGTLVVALLPIEFLDGRTIFRWRKLVWLGLYAVTLLVFLFIVVPLSDNWGTMSAPVFGWGTLFVVFAVVAVATWALFRRRRPVSSSTPAGGSPRRRARR